MCNVYVGIVISDTIIFLIPIVLLLSLLIDITISFVNIQ